MRAGEALETGFLVRADRRLVGGLDGKPDPSASCLVGEAQGESIDRGANTAIANRLVQEVCEFGCAILLRDKHHVAADPRINFDNEVSAVSQDVVEPVPNAIDPIGRQSLGRTFWFEVGVHGRELRSVIGFEVANLKRHAGLVGHWLE